MMTVRELIDLLAVAPPDMPVALFDCGSSDSSREIGAVSVEHNQVVLLGD